MTAAPVSYHDLLFPTLSEEQIGMLYPYGCETTLEGGECLYAEGDPADTLYIVIEGEIKVTKRAAGHETVLVVHHPGDFTGEIALLTGGENIASAYATRSSKLLGIPATQLPMMMAHCPWMREVMMRAMVQRRPEAMLITQQREKLASLGVMAAGLAHELNNPAAAASRAAAQLQEKFQQQQAFAFSLCKKQLMPAHLEQLSALLHEAQHGLIHPIPLDPLAQSDREDELTEWMEAHQVEDAWQIAPTLVAAGLDTARLDTLAEEMPPEAIAGVLRWLENGLATGQLIAEIENSTTRVSELVKAVKSYSYMDQAPLQEIDVHEGLESTLTILGHKLKKTEIAVTRNYDRTCPPILAYGSELNQVWTNLLDNAIDALNGRGNICITTYCESDCLFVEIADDGPGIPPEVQARIFEPFFTTKPVGQGTGLGLDIAYRIVVGRHNGDLRVESQPGSTRFQARLPYSPKEP